jgi:CBS domain-containing protein
MAGNFIQSAQDVVIKGLPPRRDVPVEEFKPSSMENDEIAWTGDKEEALNKYLLWLVKFPISQNNPRATTGSIVVWKSNGIVCVHANEPVKDVFKKLVVEGFLGAPVLNRNDKYIGFIDMLDLVNFSTNLFGGGQYERSKSGWQSFLDEEKRFKETTVREVMKRRPLLPRVPDGTYPVMQGFSLFHPYEVLARTGLRRVAVTDDKSNIVGLVTQSMLISLVGQNKSRLGAILGLKVRDFEKHLVSQFVVVKETDKAIDAFRLMAEKNVSGVAVVNSDGILVDTLSIRDLRGIGVDAERFHRLFYEVSFFKELTRAEFKKQTPAQPLTCTRDNSYNQVMNYMNDGNIHRIFIVELDERKRPRPVGVISQRDMLLIPLREANL